MSSPQVSCLVALYSGQEEDHKEIFQPYLSAGGA